MEAVSKKIIASIVRDVVLKQRLSLLARNRMNDSPQKHILLVENSPFFRLSLQKILEEEGYQVTVLFKEEEILPFVERNLPHVAILPATIAVASATYLFQNYQLPIFLFGYPKGNLKEIALLREVVLGFIYKNPFRESDMDSIRQAIRHKVRLALSLSREEYVCRMRCRKSYLLSFAAYLPYRVIVIGASTGGTEAIEEIVRALPPEFYVPIIIAQHIPSSYAYSFAERLNKISSLNVLVPQISERLIAGNVYLLSGENNTILQENASQEICFFTTDEQFSAHNFPSIDAIMQSAARIFAHKTLGIILSGMGNDGTAGMMAIAQRGGETIVQDTATSVVASMPLSAYQFGKAKKILSLIQIIETLKKLGQ